MKTFQQKFIGKKSKQNEKVDNLFICPNKKLKFQSEIQTPVINCLIR